MPRRRRTSTTVTGPRRRALPRGAQSTLRRRRTQTTWSTHSSGGGSQTSYGYYGRQDFQSNYYGTMPQRTSYGYSGTGPSQGSNLNVVMAGAAGLAVGAAVGVGGYMAYQAMTRPNYAMTGTAYDQSWCQRPSGSGSVMPCGDCFKVYGSKCTSENGCYGGGGCDFKMAKDMTRDDLMTVGFVPQFFTPPLTVTITKLECYPISADCDFKQSNMCPVQGAATFDSTWAKASSVDVNLFMTLTQVENMGSSGGRQPGSASLAPPCGPSMLLGVFLMLRLLRGHF